MDCNYSATVVRDVDLGHNEWLLEDTRVNVLETDGSRSVVEGWIVDTDCDLGRHGRVTIPNEALEI